MLVMPTIEKSDMSRLAARIDTYGYAVLPGISIGVSTDRIAENLGVPMAPWHGKAVHELTPKTVSTPNTYSGIFGLGNFPFHTDLAHWQIPPRYLLLRCVQGYADVPTLMLDGRTIAAVVGEEMMGRALTRPRRPQNGEIRILRLRQVCGLGEIIRWDQVYLRPASPVGKLVFSRFQSLIDGAQPIPVVMVDDGDVVLIDNWRMLHARPGIAPNQRNRKLERVYLRSLS